MTITINLTSTSGVNFNADFDGFFADMTPTGWPYILGGASTFEGRQIVLLDEVEAGQERDTKTIVIDGKDVNYYFNDHTLSGTMTSIRLATLGNSYDPVDGSFTQNSSGLITDISTSIEITGLNIYNAYRERGDFHDVTYGLMGGSHEGGGTSDPGGLEDFLWAEGHTVNGSSGADTYSGTRFADTINGNGGNDTLRGNQGNDRINGGAGTDTAVYSGAMANYTWAKNANGSWTITDKRANGDGTDTLTDIENLRFSDKTVQVTDGPGEQPDPGQGTPGNDTIQGTSGADRLIGDAGNDMLSGQAGNDVLNGGTGNDSLYGGAGNDTIYSGDGNDEAYGGTGNDIVYGAAGTDILGGGEGDDSVYGGAGNDTIYAGAGRDQVYGSDGNDLIYGAAGDDFVGGSAGNDELYGGAGNDELYGGDGDDRLSGGDGNDALFGGAGADRLVGGKGADVLYGGAGSDTFVFSALSDSTVNVSGRDVVSDFGGGAGDRIDLSRLDANSVTAGDQAFTFIGDSAFSNTAGELRIDDSGAATVIYGDVDGDGKADFAIDIGNTSIIESYFLL